MPSHSTLNRSMQPYFRIYLRNFTPIHPSFRLRLGPFPGTKVSVTFAIQISHLWGYNYHIILHGEHCEPFDHGANGDLHRFPGESHALQFYGSVSIKKVEGRWFFV